MPVAEKDEPAKIMNFRFSSVVRTDLDLIADHLGVETWSDALRVLIKREADKIRRKEAEK